MRITYSNKACSEHFEQDNNVKFEHSQIRMLKDGACQSLLLWATRSNLKEVKEKQPSYVKDRDEKIYLFMSIYYLFRFETNNCAASVEECYIAWLLNF